MSYESLIDRHLTQSQQSTFRKWKEGFLDTFTAIMQYRTSQMGLAIMIVFVAVAVFAPFIAPYDPSRSFTEASGLAVSLEPPSLVHPLGTTYKGNDVLSQWIYGSRVSLMVGFLSGLAVMVVGTTVGLVSGYYKGTVDLLLMRLVDILYGIPATPLILVIAMIYGSNVWVIIIAMVTVLWRTMARIIRAQTLSLAERPFIKSARAAGASDIRIMYMHIVPNLLPLIFIETTFAISSAIILEAGISFLGVGAELSWGSMLQLTFATGAIRNAWWWAVPPGLSITLLVLAFFYISRAIEDVTNPEVGRWD